MGLFVTVMKVMGVLGIYCSGTKRQKGGGTYGFGEEPPGAGEQQIINRQPLKKIWRSIVKKIQTNGA